MTDPIRLGFIGVSVGPSGYGSGSWAVNSHVPYLRSSRNDNIYKISALQNSSTASGERAVKQLELGDNIACHDDPAKIANDPNVDVVAVSVKVPSHYDAIMPALKAGKDMFVEWPLARNLSEAEAMCEIVQEKNLKTLVGLQARQDPSILAAKRIFASGQIGEVMSVTMHGYGMVFAEKKLRSFAYGFPVEAGANLLTIPFGHAIDALCFVVGELEYVSATLANRRPEFELIDDQGNTVGRSSKTAHDVISVTGVIAQGGGVVTAIYEGGFNPTGGPSFFCQINGTKGSIVLEGEHGHIQMFQPKIKLILQGETKDVEGVEWVGNDFSSKVGKAWDAFAKVRKGEAVDESCGGATSFVDALLRHRMIEAIYRSDKNGTRERYI